MTSSHHRAAVYARVSRLDQEPENQLAELRRYVEARGWSATEYVDRGVSGGKDRRPRPRPAHPRRQTQTVRRPGLLATGPTRPQPPSPHPFLRPRVFLDT